MSTFTPNEMPGAGVHRQLGMLEETGILGGVPRRQPDVLLTGEQRHRLPELGKGFPGGDRVQRAVPRARRSRPGAARTTRSPRRPRTPWPRWNGSGGRKPYGRRPVHTAIEADLRIAWFTLESLTATMGKAKVNASIARTVTRICRCDLIVVDDIGRLPAGQQPLHLTETYGTSWNLHRPQPLHGTGPMKRGETATPKSLFSSNGSRTST